MKKCIAMLAIALLCASAASARPAFAIDGTIGLQSFVSLTDAHVAARLRGVEEFAARYWTNRKNGRRALLEQRARVRYG